MAFDVGAISVRISADISDLSTQFSKGLREIDRGVRGFSDAGKELTRAITIPLAAIGVASVLAATNFEQAMAGVAKTVDAPAAEIARLGQQFVALSDQIPASAVALANVGEAAGQLGIETKNILGFTKVMTDLGVSTNLSATEAATALARLANITQLPQDQFDRLGSTVVALGNNMATTEREIVEFSLRIAGAGKQVGLSEAEMLSFGAALSSVGVEAQAGGTAISRTFVTMAQAVRQGGDDLQGFAKVAGLSAAEFKDAFEKDAAGATVKFIEGLARISNAGGDVFTTLDNLSLGEIRVRDALLRAAGAGDLFTKALKIGSVAWEENTALTEEAARFYATTKNQLLVLKNQVVNTAAAFGQQLLPALRALIDVLSSAIGVIRSAVNVFASLPAPVRNTVIAFGVLVSAIGPMLVGFAAMAKAFAVAKLAATVLTGALGLSGLAGLLVPGGAILIGISAIIGLFVTMKSKAKEAAGGIDALGSSLKKLDAKGAASEIKRLEEEQVRLSEAAVRFQDAADAAGDNNLGANFRRQANEMAQAAIALTPRIEEVRGELVQLQAIPGIEVSVAVNGLESLSGAARSISNFKVDTVSAFEIVRDKHRELVQQIAEAEFNLKFASSIEEANKLGKEMEEMRGKAQAMADELARAPAELKRLIDLTNQFGLPKVEITGPSVTTKVKDSLPGVFDSTAFKELDLVLVRTASNIEGFGVRTVATVGPMEAFIEGLTLSGEELDLSRNRLSGFSRTALDVGRGLAVAFEAAFSFVGDMASGLISLFNPLTIAGTVLDQAFRDASGSLNEKFKASIERITAVIGDALQPVLEAMIPVFDALEPIIRELAPILSAVAQIFAALFKAVAPILQAIIPLLRALFPVFKLLAIITTYVGQVFAKAAQVILYVISFFAQAVGTVIKAIGKAIDKLPFISGKSIINAGQDIIDFGKGAKESGDLMGDAFREFGKAREEIKKIELEDPAEEARDSLDEFSKSTRDAHDALDEFAQSARDARIRNEATGGGGEVVPPTTNQNVTVDSVVSFAGGITVVTSGDPEETYNGFVLELKKRVRAGSPEAQALAGLFPA